MAQVITLAAEMRDATITNKAMRRAGSVPGVLYGNQFASQSLQFGTRNLGRVIRTAGTSTLIEIDVAGGDETELALIREVQRDPVSGALLHIDLYRVVRGVAIRNAVPIVMIGEAPAVELGATVSQMLETLEIECLPKDMPAIIEVDISTLTEAGSRITVADLVIPESVDVLTDADIDVVQAIIVTMAAAEPEVELEEELLEGEEGEEGEIVEGEEGQEGPAEQVAE